MSTADRARLATIAAALAGDGQDARAAALGRALAGKVRASVRFEDVANAPEWLTLSLPERRRLGHRAALAAIAPALAASVDGAWLGGLAQVAGEDELDRAMALAPRAAMTLPVFRADELEVVAGGLLRAAAPAALRDFAGPDTGRDMDRTTAAAALALAR